MVGVAGVINIRYSYKMKARMYDIKSVQFFSMLQDRHLHDLQHPLSHDRQHPISDDQPTSRNFDASYGRKHVWFTSVCYMKRPFAVDNCFLRFADEQYNLADTTG